MANKQRKDQAVEQALRMGAMSIGGGIAANAIGQAGFIPQDVTGMGGANLPDGSVLHHGPGDPDILERPVGGYLADASHGGSVEITRNSELSNIARSLDDSSSLTIDGHTINILDYAPGGDAVQLAAGRGDPAQIMVMMGQFGMQHGISRIGQSASGFPESGMAEEGDRPETDANGKKARYDASGRRLPDIDEEARDREALAFQHRLDLDTVVETSDSARVHTQITAHGRTLSVDTDFEAYDSDNKYEREEAAEHAQDTQLSAQNDFENTARNMRFRSQIRAHIEAASKDEGLDI